MNGRSTARVLDWAVPLGFGVTLCLCVPLRTALEFGGDEGYELMKGFLVSLGHPLYREVWNDQPPLHTELLALLFGLFDASAGVGRGLSVGFAMVLVAALYRLVSERSGRVAGLVAVGLLVASSSFLQLSVSVMLELPAMALALAAVWAGSNYFAGTGRRWLVFSGVLFGCALQVKLTAAIFLPALAAEFLTRRTRFKPEVEPLGKPLSGLGARCGNDTGPRAMSRKAGWSLSSLPGGGAVWTPRPTYEAAIWCGAVAAIFGVIAVAFYGSNALPVFWASHFSADTQQAVAAEGYGFRFASLLNDLALLVPAAAGVALIGWKRRWDLLFPVVLLATVLAIHLWHRPYWYYYGLHFAIPLAWLGAVGIVEWFRALWQLDFTASRGSKVRAGIGVLSWSVMVSLALTLAPEKAWNALLRLAAAAPASADPRVVALRRHAAETHWVFTDRVIYAFWAGLPVPPELAVVPSKRIWSGQINRSEIERCLERYRPEQILLESDWISRFGLIHYLQQHYRPDPANSVSGLRLRQ